MSRILPFIEDEKILKIVSDFLDEFKDIQEKAEQKLEDNALDPFSAILFSVATDSDLETWMTGELNRQIGKSFQNNIGELHQTILGSCDGWEVIDDVFDVRGMGKKVIAEIKNKHNTTKGNHKIAIYDDLAASLEKPEYKGFTAYYVEIIPKKRKVYNVSFSPSDNKTKDHREAREDIRRIDGKSFYDLVTGYKGSLKMLYDTIPYLVDKIQGKGLEIGQDPLFNDLYNKTYE